MRGCKDQYLTVIQAWYFQPCHAHGRMQQHPEDHGPGYLCVWADDL